MNYNAVSPLRDAAVLDFHEHKANERARHGRERAVFIKPHGPPESPGLLLRKGNAFSSACAKLILFSGDEHDDDIGAITAITPRTLNMKCYLFLQKQ